MTEIEKKFFNAFGLDASTITDHILLELIVLLSNYKSFERLKDTFNCHSLKQRTLYLLTYIANNYQADNKRLTRKILEIFEVNNDR